MIKFYEEKNIKNIADAIREKNGSSDTYTTSEMAAAIKAIETGGGFWNEETVKKLINRSVEVIVLPEGLSKIGSNIFQNCANLTTIELPNSITDIESNAFYECKNLILNALPSNVSQIRSYAFGFCESIINMVLPSSITEVENYAFGWCSNLTNVTFEGTPTTIGAKTFWSCSNLKTINVPWAEGAVDNAPWGASNAVINYNYIN